MYAALLIQSGYFRLWWNSFFPEDKISWTWTIWLLLWQQIRVWVKWPHLFGLVLLIVILDECYKPEAVTCKINLYRSSDKMWSMVLRGRGTRTSGCEPCWKSTGRGWRYSSLQTSCHLVLAPDATSCTQVTNLPRGWERWKTFVVPLPF